MLRRLFPVVSVLVSLSACGPMMAPAELVITLSPRAVTDATPIRVTVTATNGDGSIGQGTVKVTSSAGSLTSGTEVTLDEFGRAVTSLVCDPTVESLCSPNVRVVAEWNAGPKVGIVTGEARATATKPPPVPVDPEANPDGGLSSFKPYVLAKIDAATCEMGFAPFTDIRQVSLGITVNYGVATTPLCGTVFGALDTSDTSNGDNRTIPVAAPHQITPAGELLYIGPDYKLHQWVADPLAPNTGGSRYPPNSIDNDPIVPTPGCSEINEFLLRPTGELAYVCRGVGLMTRSWVQNGTPLPTLSNGETFAALGPGLSGLIVRIAGGFAVYRAMDTSGVVHDLLPTSILDMNGGGVHRPVRWVDDHWLVAHYYRGQFIPSSLLSITPGGALAILGTYDTPPFEVNVAGGVMDRRGQLYLRATVSDGVNLHGALLRYPLSGGALTPTNIQMSPPSAAWGDAPMLELRVAEAFIFSGP